MEKNETMTNQFLTFRLAKEVFAIEIFRVKEVLEYREITKIPNTPEFIKGVINLRGNVVTVVDMRQKLGMEIAELTVNTCIIIVEALYDGENVVVGALVDSVQEVVDIDGSQIEPPPKMGTGINTEFLQGMGKKEEEFIMIIDIDSVFSKSELSMITETNQE